MAKKMFLRPIEVEDDPRYPGWVRPVDDHAHAGERIMKERVVHAEKMDTYDTPEGFLAFHFSGVTSPQPKEDDWQEKWDKVVTEMHTAMDNLKLAIAELVIRAEKSRKGVGE